MIEHLEQLKKWSDSGQPIAVARVIKTWGSSPRPVGSAMFINSDGKMLGSVSGGCVEGSVVKSAKTVIETGNAQNLSFGVSDEEAWSVGLTCGGSINIFLEKVPLAENEVWSELINNISRNQSSILVSSLEDGRNSLSLVDTEKEVIGDSLSESILTEAEKAYSERNHKLIETDGIAWFIQVFPRKPQLLIIGAAHITVDLVNLGNSFGFETIVIDPRGYFAENTVFPDPPSRILQSYPSEVLGEFTLDAYTFAAVLSHDPKIDDNALEILLPSKIAYIGALGSRKTHAKRIQRLLDKGINQDLIDRIQSPIGLDIHAKSAREIALSIISEIVQIKNQHR